jgi:N-acetyl-gamma-glutamyl-phosphate/LysW-gamma-L-alpha-aminoadipyl-6-phosphate reductase
MDYVKSFLETDARIIDLSADFRFRSANEYAKWYGTEHKYPELLERAVYGLPELHKEAIKKAKLVACPGCLPTSAILPLAPLVTNKLIDLEHIVIDSKIGSSAGGHKADLSTHHPERAGAVRSYKPTGHRHIGEIEQELGILTNEKVKVAFSPHAIELIRGIMTTIHTYLKKEIKEVDVWKIYRSFYANCPFIRYVKEKEGIHRYPEPKNVAGTNFCDIGFELDSNIPRLVVMSAIDNLVKGSGGQAIQCMNLMFNLDEKMGLWVPSLHPA